MSLSAALPSTDSPETAARAFLNLLDTEQWDSAAALICPDAAERFKEQTLEVARLLAQGASEHAAYTDTLFVSPLHVLGATLDELQAWSATQLVGRWAAALYRSGESNWSGDMPSSALPSPSSPMRLTRSVLHCVRRGSSAQVYYRTDWYDTAGRMPQRGGTQILSLLETSRGWRVVDVDFTGEGTGHLVIPPAAWSALKASL
jgi:hypothetical protein